MKYLVLHEGAEAPIEVRELGPGHFECTAFGRTFTAHADAPSPESLTLHLNGEVYDVAFEGKKKDTWGVRLRGAVTQIEVLDPRAAQKHHLQLHDGEAGQWRLEAPMPGKVTAVLVEVGQEVKAGQGLVVVEAMKMENELRAPQDGTIAKVHVAVGATVEASAPLVDAGAPLGDAG